MLGRLWRFGLRFHLSLLLFGGSGLRVRIALAHLIHVISGLFIWRNVLIFRHRARTRIVRRERELIVFINFLELLQITHACFDVLFRIKAVGHAKHLCSGRHQLHQPLRAFRRHRLRVVIAFHFDH